MGAAHPAIEQPDRRRPNTRFCWNPNVLLTEFRFFGENTKGKIATAVTSRYAFVYMRMHSVVDLLRHVECIGKYPYIIHSCSKLLRSLFGSSGMCERVCQPSRSSSRYILSVLEGSSGERSLSGVDVCTLHLGRKSGGSFFLCWARVAASRPRVPQVPRCRALVPKRYAAIRCSLLLAIWTTTPSPWLGPVGNAATLAQHRVLGSQGVHFNHGRLTWWSSAKLPTPTGHVAS